MTAEDCIESLLRDFQNYDRVSDVVSIFESLYTKQAELSPTVAHFERFPRIKMEEDFLTPDFTILLDDDTAMVAEIARVSLQEGSLDSICHQLARYETICSVPGPNGEERDVDLVDVVLLVEMDVGPGAMNRIAQRIADEASPFKPIRPPVLLQFAAFPDKYVLQHIADPRNGRLSRPGKDALQHWFDRDSVKVQPKYFTDTKTVSPFVNDPCPPIYLATMMWSRVLPEMEGQTVGQGQLLTIEESDLVQVMRRYGKIRTSDVGRSLQFLAQCGLANQMSSKQWQVLFVPLPSSRRRSTTEEKLAQRFCDPPKSRSIDNVVERSQPKPGPVQPKLF